MFSEIVSIKYLINNQITRVELNQLSANFTFFYLVIIIKRLVIITMFVNTKYCI